MRLFDAHFIDAESSVVWEDLVDCFVATNEFAPGSFRDDFESIDDVEDDEEARRSALD